MKKETKDKNIFEEAAEQAVIDNSKIKTELEKNNEKIALYVSQNPGSEFQKLQEAIEGPFAEKFMNIMNNLPDKDFMRYYLKTLEYFKPKVTRVEPPSRGEGEDNIIQVNIMQVNKDGEISTMVINDKKE